MVNLSLTTAKLIYFLSYKNFEGLFSRFLKNFIDFFDFIGNIQKILEKKYGKAKRSVVSNSYIKINMTIYLDWYREIKKGLQSR